jgi:hypothetical protein
MVFGKQVYAAYASWELIESPKNSNFLWWSDGKVAAKQRPFSGSMKL